VHCRPWCSTLGSFPIRENKIRASHKNSPKLATAVSQSTSVEMPVHNHGFRSSHGPPRCRRSEASIICAYVAHVSLYILADIAQLLNILHQLSRFMSYTLQGFFEICIGRSSLSLLAPGGLETITVQDQEPHHLSHSMCQIHHE